MLRAVIFDFNGIIVNDEPIHFRLFQRVLAEERIPLTEDAYYARYLGFDDRGAFTAAYKDSNRLLEESKLSALIERKAALYQIAIRDQVDIFPGVQSLIEDLASELPLAVASGALRHEIDTILSTARLSPYFKAIVSAEDVTRGKPEPEIFLKALELLNTNIDGQTHVTAAECVVIEDSKEGVKGARRAGMQCLAVTNSHPAEVLGDATAVVPSLEKVNLSYLRSLVR
ncbi:MAG TPA: HAD family phosphatase [Candidatus Binatia bacterium]|jgi:HAD superfamily hydrolase (TIGR01509 family)